MLAGGVVQNGTTKFLNLHVQSAPDNRDAWLRALRVRIVAVWGCMHIHMTTYVQIYAYMNAHVMYMTVCQHELGPFLVRDPNLNVAIGRGPIALFVCVLQGSV